MSAGGTTLSRWRKRFGGWPPAISFRRSTSGFRSSHTHDSCSSEALDVGDVSLHALEHGANVHGVRSMTITDVGAWKNLVVVCAANRYDGIKLADQHMADHLAQWIPVLYVDP